MASCVCFVFIVLEQRPLHCVLWAGLGGGVDDALIFDFVGSECSKKIRMIDGTIVNQSSTVDII
jgi:hypothetical protein